MARGGKYWVIVSGGTPTSFRARDRETLLPTLVQLQRTQPDAAIKWFDGTRFFDTMDEAMARSSARDGFRRERKQDWRPGGEHRDPRAKYDVPRDVLANAMGWVYGINVIFGVLTLLSLIPFLAGYRRRIAGQA
mgnify:CR=1 FL=1